MSCGNSSPVSSFSVQYFYNSNCTDCSSDCGGTLVSSGCVYYAGPALTCSGIATNDSLETALQKIDTQICSATGDYSTYQFNCLTAWFGSNITTEAEFVDAITGYACEITDNFDTFTGTTFTDYQGTVDTRFIALEVPGITCVSADVEDTDTLQVVLAKYCIKFGEIDTALDLSTVIWNACFTVPSPPLSIAEGFSLLADQICQIYSTSVALPTFDNSSNCLAGGVDDTLVTTVGLLTDYICTTGIFDASSVAWGCLDNSATTLQTAFQTVVTKASDLQKNFVTFDGGDFVVTQTDGGDECQGITVALATPINVDRFVAATAGDASPSTLIDKLTAGTGITITDNTTSLEISASGTVDSYEVLADAADDTPGFLDDKITGAEDSGITISPTYDSIGKTLVITPIVNPSELFTRLLNQLTLDSDLYTLFCQMIAGCPSPCDGPDNVQVALLSTTTTTLA